MIENKEIEPLSNEPFKMDDILENFECSLSEEIAKKGHLYINDHCVKFSSEDKETTLLLNFNEIKQIILNGENIEIETNKENKINFFSFDDFNSAFDKINYIFKLYIESQIKEEKNYSSDSGDSNNDNDEANKRSPSSKFSLYSSVSNDNETSSSSSKDIISLRDMNNSKQLKETQSTENIKKLVFDEDNEENKKMVKNNSSNEINVNINLLESKEKEEKEKIEFPEMDPNVDYEVCKKIIDLPPKELFEKYQTNKNPETSYAAYYKWVGEYSEINVQDWEKIETKEDKEDKVIEKYQRKETFCLALHGVPIINKSDVEKTCTYWIENDGTYYLHIICESRGVPLSSHFNVETHAEFHPFSNNTKTVFRTYVRTNIIKWSIFKPALIYQGKRNYIQEVEQWLKFIVEKGDKIEGDYCI